MTSKILFLLIFILTLCQAPKPLQAQLHNGFVEITINNEIYRPVGITFDQNGNAYVWEREGMVHIIDSSGHKLPDPLIDISEEVGGWGDHGLLGFALHPNFETNGFFYLLYVVDRHHLLYFGTNEYEPDSTITNEATIGRITRYTADPATNFTSTIPDSRKVLLGESIDSGMPIVMSSHGVGSLVFGTDGTLLASCGDAGSFETNDVGSAWDTYFAQALTDGIIREKENIGSLRAQLVDCMNGKILRMDPETGDGLPSNPYFDSEHPRSPASRVWSLGLRNPYRFKLRPGTGSHFPTDGNPGTLYIGDVGSNKWEELNVATGPGQNFGYPFFEGYLPKPPFWNQAVPNQDAPNPLYLEGMCQQEYYNFHELIQQVNPVAGQVFPNTCDPALELDPALTYYHSLPKIIYNNKLGNPPARAYVATLKSEGGIDTINITTPGSPVSGSSFSGYSSIAGVFYEGDAYPEAFRGKYFHADYAWWIRTMDFDENNELTKVEPFHLSARYILDMAINPKDDCIYYLDFQSRVQKIMFGGNAPPVASIKANQYYGPSPLEILFDASDSYDPEGTALTYLWHFGDGTTSSEIQPTHIFETPDNIPMPFEVSLFVTDSLNAVDSSRVIISLNNTPPEVDIVSVQDSSFYAVSGFTILPLSAEVKDAEHDASQLSYSWQSFLQHNTHDHAEPINHERETSTIIEPIGCNEEYYWFKVVLEIGDAAGLVGSDTVELFPHCGDPPAVLTEWNGQALKETIALNWETELETDLAYFEIQKIVPPRGLSYLGKVSAIGSNSGYSLVDDSPENGINTYRLKMVDVQGVFDYSPLLKVLFPAKPDIVVFPNPATDELWFELGNPGNQVSLDIFNHAGQLLRESNWHEVSSFYISVSDLPNGVYFYRVKNDQENLSGSFLIYR